MAVILCPEGIPNEFETPLKLDSVIKQPQYFAPSGLGPLPNIGNVSVLSAL